MLTALVDKIADPTIPLQTMLLRLLLSVVLGLFIGIEREMHRQPAGMRTHILICIGATLITIASMYLPMSVSGIGLSVDAARITAQIVSGIGFLGAGAIIKFGATVRGITTAATIWVTAAIGITVGLGLFYFSFFATLFVLVVLVGFESFEQRIFSAEFFKALEVEIDPSVLKVVQIRELLVAHRVRVRTVDMQVTNSGMATAIFHLRIAERVHTDALLAEIFALASVREVKLSQEYR